MQQEWESEIQKKSKVLRIESDRVSFFTPSKLFCLLQLTAAFKLLFMIKLIVIGFSAAAKTSSNLTSGSKKNSQWFVVKVEPA